MEKLSRYLEDKKFILWVFEPGEELEQWWAAFQSENPRERENILMARKVLHTLKTKNKNLSDEEKILLFSRILRQVEERQLEGSRNRRIISMLKYAAVAVLFFSLGALLFYRQDNFSQQFYSRQFTEPGTGSDARLIRSDGRNIPLQSQKPVIEHRGDGSVVIDKDMVEEVAVIRNTKPELNQLIIPYGKTSEILLPDGSKVYLNAGSRLVYPDYFTGKSREVFLVGEAFFEVKSDGEHPFVVQTSDIRIKVLGTRFNVSAYPTDNSIETVLTEGRVKIELNKSGLFSGDVELLPNHLASFSRESQEFRLSQVNPEFYTLWKEGIFHFESTDLNRIVKKLERFYNIRFGYRDPVLGTIRISGKLELAENREEVINRLAVAASVNIIKKGETYYEIK